jgi:hypothetical protein
LGTLAVFLLAASALSGTALAGDSWEVWPEVWTFVRLSPQVRLFFDAAYAKGKESPSQALDLAAYVDVSIRPILRPTLRQEDWASSRFLWARIGYDHVLRSEGGTPAPPEDRGIVSLYAKGGLPAKVWLEGRTRADLRWIDGVYSTRYRFRLEATREFTVWDHPMTPYANGEWFYDTRYDGWARELYQAGSEFTVSRRFRFELYVARQIDNLPSESSLSATGAIVKFYF